MRTCQRHLSPSACDLELTPRLDVHGDDRFGSRLSLAGLLLPVLLKPLSLDPLGLLINLVVGAEKVDIVVVVSGGGGSLGRVDRKLALLGTVGGVRLGWVAGQGGELGLERGNVLVPASGVGELLDGGGRLEGLEGLDIGLGRTIAKTRQRMIFPLARPCVVRITIER